MFFEKLRKKIAVLKCHTHLGKARVNITVNSMGDITDKFLVNTNCFFETSAALQVDQLYVSTGVRIL